MPAISNPDTRGAARIRQMTDDDLPLGLRLSAQTGWNQTEADWRRFLWLEPEGCFVAEWDGVPAATTAAFVFGSIGWIAMVLVDEPFRHRGIATGLVKHALQYLDLRGVQTVRLDATSLGRPVYQRLGFVAEYALARMQVNVATPYADPSFAPLAADRVQAVCDLDAQVTGTVRGRLIRHLHAERPSEATGMFQDEAASGYAFLRPGRRAVQIGPAAATSAATGTALLDQVLARCPVGPAYLDVPLDNRSAVQWAESRGFAVQREFMRMHRGQRLVDWPQQIWASSGPEKG